MRAWGTSWRGGDTPGSLQSPKSSRLKSRSQGLSGEIVTVSATTENQPAAGAAPPDVQDGANQVQVNSQIDNGREGAILGGRVAGVHNDRARQRAPPVGGRRARRSRVRDPTRRVARRRRRGLGPGVPTCRARVENFDEAQEGVSGVTSLLPL